MYLFDLASTHMNWLSQRQSVTAANVANVDSPGYRAREVSPFQRLLDGSAPTLATTHPAHMPLGRTAMAYDVSERDSRFWDTAHSRNNVAIEQELMTASSTTRMMGTDAALLRSFQRMILSSVKV